MTGEVRPVILFRYMDAFLRCNSSYTTLIGLHICVHTTPGHAMSFQIDLIPNRGRAPQVLLRQSWRGGKRIRHKTIANLSKFPAHVVDGFRAVLKGGTVFTSVNNAVAIRRSLPHGHVAATLGMDRTLDLPHILDRQRRRPAALAAVVARLTTPASKLATARQLSPDTANSSLGALLDLGPVTGNEMLDMLDWLHVRQPWIERSLANRHLRGGTLILHDVSSSVVEGRCCPLAAFGHDRDGKKGKKQITYGLLCSAQGCPVAVEVFTGNTADPSTVSSRNTPVEKAALSDSAKAKADTRATPDGLPVHSFDTLLQDLATLTLNEVTLPNPPHSRARPSNSLDSYRMFTVNSQAKSEKTPSFNRAVCILPMKFRLKDCWWRHERPRPEMWRRLGGLSRHIATPRVAKHRLFVWCDARICPDCQLIVIARDDDTTFGILHSRFHEAWALRLGTSLEDRPRYTPTTTFETFPFPDGLSPDAPSLGYAGDRRAHTIAGAARRLVELRDRWLNPLELVEQVGEPVAGYLWRLAPCGESAARELRKRTLTSLYNARPRWLADGPCGTRRCDGSCLRVGRGHLRRGGAERIAGAQLRSRQPFMQKCTARVRLSPLGGRSREELLRVESDGPPNPTVPHLSRAERACAA